MKPAFAQELKKLAVPLTVLAMQTFAVFLQESSFGRLHFADAASIARWGLLIGAVCLWMSLRNRRAAQHLGTRVILVGFVTLSLAWSLLSLVRGMVAQ